jgi:hypothetical protein
MDAPPRHFYTCTGADTEFSGTMRVVMKKGQLKHSRKVMSVVSNPDQTAAIRTQVTCSNKGKPCVTGHFALSKGRASMLGLARPMTEIGAEVA